jgi:hypothetical protein
MFRGFCFLGDSGCGTHHDVLLVFLTIPFAAVANVVDGGPTAPVAEARTVTLTPATAVDLFRPNGEHLGYAVQRRDGSVDVFRADGSRMGFGRPGER